MFRDEYISGGSSLGNIHRVGLERSDHEQRIDTARSLTERARARTLLDIAFKATGPLSRQGNYLSGGGKVYEIVTGGAQVVAELMQQRKEIISRDVNLLGRKPIKI